MSFRFKILLGSVVCASALGQSGLQSPVTVYPTSISSAEIKLRERYVNSTTTKFVGLKAPDDVSTSTMFVLPDGGGTTGDCLKSAGGTGTVQIITAFCDSLWEVWTGPSSVISVRPSGVYQTQVRSIRMADQATGSDANGEWVMSADVSATDSRLRLVDQAGVEILVATSKVGGSPVYELTVNSDIIPPTNDYGKIGKTGRIFDEGHFDTVYMNACVGAGCGGGSFWSRDTFSGYVYPAVATDDVRTKAKIQFEGASSSLVQDILATTTITDERMAFRDKAGGEMLRLSRKFVGAVDNSATFDGSVLPLTNTTYNIGSSSKYWNDMRGTDYYGSTIRPKSGSDFDAHSNWRPSASVTWDLGSSSRRWLKLWVQDIDCSGSCGGSSYWSRDSGSGFVYPSTATDDVRTKAKIQFEGASGALVQDILATTTITDERMDFRDKAGVPMLRLSRKFVGSTSNAAELDVDVYPLTSLTRSLGLNTRQWNDLYSDSAHIRFLATASGSDIFFFNHFLPITTASNLDVGGPSNRINTVYTQNIDCTVSCGSNFFSDNGVTVSLTNTGRNFAVGTSATAYKFEVALGNSRFGGETVQTGDWLCETDGGCAIGDSATGTANRPSQGYFTTAVSVYNGGGTTQRRGLLSNAGLTLTSSGGSNTFTVSSTGGGSLTVDGLTAVTFTSPGGCVFTRGIMTTSCSTW